MAIAAVQLPGRLSSLPFFLTAWVLSYLAPHLLVATLDDFIGAAMVTASAAAWQVEGWAMWVGVLPALYAGGQWLLMRRCLANPVPWVAAIYVGTLLSRVGTMLIPVSDPRLLFADPLLREVVLMLVSIVGASAAVTLVNAVPVGLCFGLTMAIPQAIVLPAARRARIVWFAVMFLAELASTVLFESLYRFFQLNLVGSFQRDLVGSPLDPGFWVSVITLNYVPRLCAWLLVAVVGGLMMHAVLRRRLGAVDDRLYARFD